MDICRCCGNKITDAQFLLVEEQVYKSCPGCSKEEKEHIYYLCPQEFGTTEKRITMNNRMGLQSHCNRCRGGNTGIHEGGKRCSESSNIDGAVISEIRFLPMSVDIFDTYEKAKNFIVCEMPGRGDTYYFRKSKMDCAKNALVLFQYKGKLIAYAIYESTTILDKPYVDGTIEYLGYYTFKSQSIHLLNTPITAEQFAELDNTFKSFNQSHQRIAIGLLPVIFRFIKQNGGTTKWREKRDYVITLPEEITEDDEKTLCEGQKKQIIVNAYERNPDARERCLKYYKKINNGRVKCEVCGFDFGKVYGEEFVGKIHVHHLKEISSIGEEYEIDAEHDLIPICPNCHMVAHSRRPAYMPAEIRNMIKNK